MGFGLFGANKSGKRIMGRPATSPNPARNRTRMNSVATINRAAGLEILFKDSDRVHSFLHVSSRVTTNGKSTMRISMYDRTLCSAEKGLTIFQDS